MELSDSTADEVTASLLADLSLSGSKSYSDTFESSSSTNPRHAVSKTPGEKDVAFATETSKPEEPMSEVSGMSKSFMSNTETSREGVTNGNSNLCYFKTFASKNAQEKSFLVENGESMDSVVSNNKIRQTLSGRSPSTARNLRNRRTVYTVVTSDSGLSPWEQWLIRKEIERRKFLEQQKKEQLILRLEELQGLERKQEVLITAANNWGAWLRMKNQEERERRKKLRMQESQEREAKKAEEIAMREKAREKYKLWRELKEKESKEWKKLVAREKRLSEEERLQQKKRSDLAVREWWARVKSQRKSSQRTTWTGNRFHSYFTPRKIIETPWWGPLDDAPGDD